MQAVPWHFELDIQSRAAAMLHTRRSTHLTSAPCKSTHLVLCTRTTCRRSIQVLGTRKTQQVTVADSEAAQEAGVQSGGPFGALVDYFLNRASSSLKRGPATCLTCKGLGSCECPQCKGAGVLDREQSRMNQMRHTAQKLQQVLHMDRSNYNTEWLVTNRCRRCHGYGAVTCPTCGGMGMRSPAVKLPSQQ